MKNNLPFEKSHRLDKLLNNALSFNPALLDIKDQILEIDYYLPKLRYPAGEKIDSDTALHIYETFESIEPILRNFIKE